jgi:hypothetical protein
MNCTYKTYPFYKPCPRQPFLGLSVVVPIEPHYPLYFLAQYKTRDEFISNPVLETTYYGGALDLDVLTKRSPSAPWRLSFSTETSSPTKTPPAFVNVVTMKGVGYDDGLDGPVGFIMTGPMAKVPDLFAAYYQAWKDTGAPPPGTDILGGTFTSDMGAQIAAGGEQGAVSGGTRLDAYWKADVATTGVWRFGARLTAAGNFGEDNPFLMECFSLEVDNVYTPGPGEGALVQRESQIDYGPGLAPGVYSRIVESTLHNSCAVTNGSEYVAIGYGGGDIYAESGTLVNGGQG